ncbi:hypothetical protein [Nonomuraea zeae]|uniref:hypothetical protein n=1 Tax=Nonomuraea zeae TaxID=1642303 RepID=UPI001478CB12|nr:hypothetical protein [Nonomuraea zeae]
MSLLKVTSASTWPAFVAAAAEQPADSSRPSNTVIAVLQRIPEIRGLSGRGSAVYSFGLLRFICAPYPVTAPVLWHDGGMLAGRPVIRALRAGAFTAVCLLASAGLHLLVGGAAVRPGDLFVATAAMGVSAYALGGRRRGWPELLALCAASQYALHQLFTTPSLIDLPLAKSPVASPAASLSTSLSTNSSTSLSASHEHGGGPAMLLVHVAVALAASWWLARGELALATLLHLNATCLTGLRSLVAAAITVLALFEVSAPASSAPSRHRPVCRVPALLAQVLTRRGPPATPARG